MVKISLVAFLVLFFVLSCGEDEATEVETPSPVGTWTGSVDYSQILTEEDIERYQQLGQGVPEVKDYYSESITIRNENNRYFRTTTIRISEAIFGDQLALFEEYLGEIDGEEEASSTEEGSWRIEGDHYIFIDDSTKLEVEGFIYKGDLYIHQTQPVTNAFIYTKQ